MKFIPEVKGLYFFEDENLKHQVKELTKESFLQQQETTFFNDYSRSARVYVLHDNVGNANLSVIREKLFTLIDLISDLVSDRYIHYYANIIPLRKFSEAAVKDYTGYKLFDRGNAEIEPLIYRYYCGTFYVSRKLKKLQSRHYKTKEEATVLFHRIVTIGSLTVAILSLLFSIIKYLNDICLIQQAEYAVVGLA